MCNVFNTCKMNFHFLFRMEDNVVALERLCSCTRVQELHQNIEDFNYMLTIKIALHLFWFHVLKLLLITDSSDCGVTLKSA